ncbi:MAG: hypothetical protein MJY89_00745 [Bacteroidales bacterium]|nr:hypothetical protein [Bacteroidales bacterium]
MKIAVDFDGTIVDHRFPKIGNPKPFAFEVLKALKEEGNQLILWSNREGKHLQEAIDFCKQNGMEFYATNSDFPDASWTGNGVSRKLVADVYIDDKNLGGLPDWLEIYAMLSKNPDSTEFADNDLVRTARKRAKKRHARKKVKHHRTHNAFLDFFRGIAERCKDARLNFRF